MSAFQQGGEVAGTFFVVVTASPGGTWAPWRPRCDEELRRVAEGGRADEMERTVNQMETGFVRALERVGGFGARPTA